MQKYAEISTKLAIKVLAADRVSGSVCDALQRGLSTRFGGPTPAISKNMQRVNLSGESLTETAYFGGEKLLL